MKSKTKKLISLALCLALVFGVICAAPFSVAAESYNSGTTGDCTWSYANNTLTISGQGSMGSYNPNIHYRYFSQIDKLTIAPWGIWDEYITKIVISAGVTNIGTAAFCELPNAVTVEIADTVTEIKDYAFMDCVKLGAVSVPDSVESIGACAFENCQALTTARLPQNLAAISDRTFYNCGALANLSMPSSSLTSIGKYAFYKCSSLPAVELHTGLLSIGQNAFQGCTSLTSFTIPNGTLSLGDRTFQACTSLAEIIIPQSVTDFGDDTFLGTPWWSSQPSGAFYINNCLLDYRGTCPASFSVRKGTKRIYGFSGQTALQKITIPNSVEKLGNYVFYQCTNLSEITIPDGVTSIGDVAFFQCRALTEIAIPDSVTYLGNNSFRECTSLVTVRLSEGLISFSAKIADQNNGACGAYAFNDCTALSYVILPNSLVSVNNAFQGCTALTRVLALNPSFTKDSAFTNAAVYKLSPSGDCAVSYRNHTLTISGSGAMANYTESSPAVWNRFPEFVSEITSVVVEKGVTSVGDRAFSGFPNLKNVTLPASVTRIGDSAFEDCGALEQLPDMSRVTYLGKNALDNTAWLNSQEEGPVYANDIFVTYKGTCPALFAVTRETRVVAAGALSGCETLEQIGVHYVDYINKDAFRGCPNLIAAGFSAYYCTIEDGAFLDCPKLVFYCPKNSSAQIYAENNHIIYGITTDDTGDCTWTLHAGRLIVSGSGNMANYATPADSPFDIGITHIIIEEGVTGIGANCFSKLTNLQEITLPRSLTSVPPDSAFPPVEFTAYVYRNSNADRALKNKENVTLIYLDLLGDANGDEAIDVRDVTAVQRHIAELEPLTDEQFLCADVNCDGVVDVDDATYLQMYLAEFQNVPLG